MFKKITIPLILGLVILTNCATARDQIREGNGFAESKTTEKAGISMSDSSQYDIDPEAYGMNSVQIIGGDEDSLRDFISRWFNPLYPGATTDTGTTIWIGKNPDDFPIPFPLPKDSLIIASVENPTMSLSVILDVPHPLNDTVSNYNQTLEAASWNLMPENSQQGGFTASYAPWFTYCKEQEEAALSLQAFPREEEITEIRIDLYNDNFKYTCDPETANQMDPASVMLPVLKMPSGALLLGAGSSSSNGQAESSSDIKTELKPQELIAHLSPQMQAAGWNLLDEGDLAGFAWSSWSIMDDHDDPWSGTLLLLEDPASQDRMYALLRVVRRDQ
jgi:hypothetical protein